MNKIAVIDYGMGNLHSVSKALEKVTDRYSILITSNKSEINEAEKIVIPGVGAIGDCKKALDKVGLDKVVKENVLSKPTLAICVGMQLFLEFSEESGGTECLGLFDGHIERLPQKSEIKVPHMGWNLVKQTSDHPMWKNIPDSSYFYFVHSYCCKDSNQAVGKTKHGIEFVSAIAKDFIFAVQFHPEKSQSIGLQLYKNFIEWNGAVE